MSLLSIVGAKQDELAGWGISRPIFRLAALPLPTKTSWKYPMGTFVTQWTRRHPNRRVDHNNAAPAKLRHHDHVVEQSHGGNQRVSLVAPVRDVQSETCRNRIVN